MNVPFTYFTVHRIPHTGSTSAIVETVMVLLDIQQNHVTHASILEVLSKQYDVICLEMNNQSADPETFHWTPTMSKLQEELRNIASELSAVSLCVAQGFAATLVHYLPLERTGDILCNPSLPTKDVRFIRFLSGLLWSSTKTSLWFSNLIESSWRENLTWPLQGPSPWVSQCPIEQARYPLRITNGTWKLIFGCILKVQQESLPENTVVFIGSESPTTSSFSPAQLHHHFSGSNVRHRIFSELRQELLLAESVQRDILQVCEELL